MSNFHDYLLKDIKEKKDLLNVFPSNTELRKQKYIDSIVDVRQKYIKSKGDIRKYILYKYEEILPKKTIYNVTAEEEEIAALRKLITLGNPLTSYFERLEFDILLFDLLNYSNSSIDKLNDVLNQYISKFNLIGIKLNAKNFKINIYAYTYMCYFFKKYDSETGDPDSIELYHNEFERIYWKCPKIFEYIIVCLRMLTLKYEKKFERYVDNTFRLELRVNNFASYDDLLKKVRTLLLRIETTRDEDEYDIVHLCMDGVLDINTLPSTRLLDFDYFMIERFDLEDEIKTNQLIASIKKLGYNLSEYKQYLNYGELFKYFKTTYGPLLNEPVSKKDLLKEANKNIDKQFKKVIKLSHNKYYELLADLESNITNDINDKLFIQDKELTELFKLTIEYNNMYFDIRCRKLFKANTTAGEILELVNSYPFFARTLFTKMVSEIEDETEVANKFLEMRDLVYNPHRKLLDIIQIFTEQNILNMLTVGYRFENLNIYEDSFDEANINEVYNRCIRILRRKKMDSFTLSVEQINFLAEVNKLKNENKI